jgi:hypothetical protein
MEAGECEPCSQYLRKVANVRFGIRGPDQDDVAQNVCLRCLSHGYQKGDGRKSKRCSWSSFIFMVLRSEARLFTSLRMRDYTGVSWQAEYNKARRVAQGAEGRRLAAEYARSYRAAHPEYMQRQREKQRVRSRAKRLLAVS